MVEMQEENDLRMQIEEIQVKLSFIDSALQLATDGDKTEWQIKRLELEEQLEELEKRQREQMVSVAFTPDEAESALQNLIMTAEKASNADDHTISDWEAEAMLQAILSAEEPTPRVIPAVEESMPPVIPAAEAFVPQQPVSEPIPAQTAILAEEAAPQTVNVQPQTDVPVAAPTDAETLALRAQARRELENARAEAERIKAEAEQIRLDAESKRAMFAAEMELERGRRTQLEAIRQKREQEDKNRLAEKIARRKAEITILRNDLQDVKDTDSAFVLREKFFSIQTVLDEEERSSTEITFLIAKSLDDINHAVEIAELKRKLAVLTAKPAKKAAAPARKPAVRKKKAAAPARTRRAAPARRRTSAAAPRARRPMAPPRRRPAPRSYSRYY